MIKIVFVTFLLVQLTLAETETTKLLKPCDFGCPMDCPYGVSHQENKDRGCMECICRETLCDTVKCRSGFTCKTLPTVDGCEMPEMCSYKAECVPIEKRGICPLVSMNHLALNEDNHACSNDTECKDSMKCCKTEDEKLICLEPCMRMMIRCRHNFTVVAERNAKGCEVLKCVRNKHTDSSEHPTDQFMVHLDACLQEKKTGPCRASFPRYFYNSTSQQCEKFIYGGCKGNENQFRTVEECQKRCVKSKLPEDLCQLDSESGMCLAYIERYFYNRSSNQCEKFIYGGCGGNANNFERIEDCEKRCSPNRHLNRCILPQERGMCLALIPRFFFNTTSQKCEFFHYGGCGGNENNFMAMESCIKECSKRESYSVKEACLAEKVQGNCKASIERFFFNKETFKCEKFIYGGCDGNENNFESELECESKCFGFDLN